MKTKEELNALKEEVETVRKKLRMLTDDEFAQETGGTTLGGEGEGFEDTFIPFPGFP